MLRSLIIYVAVSLLFFGCSNKISQQDVSADALKQSTADQGSNTTSSTGNSTLDTDQLPDNSSTLVDQPVKNPPVANPPVESTPSSNPPVANQPESNPPVANPPVASTPSSNPPVANPPVESTPSTHPPVANPPVASTPSSNPPVANPPATDTQEDKDCISWALNDEPEATASCLKKKSSASESDKDKDKDHDNGKDKDKDDDVVKTKTPSEKCYVKSEEDKDDTDYESLCRLNKKQIKFLNVVSNLLKIFKLRGLTVLTPESLNSSSLDSIEDVRGTIILCGLKVGKVENTRGKLVAVDSTINSFSNHRGKAVFINTAAESCSDIKGKFVLLGAKSACKSIENSKGLVQINRD